MRKISFILLTFILLFSAQPVIAASQGALSVNPTTVDTNGTVTASGGGFLSGADVIVTFDGDGAKTITADVNGNVSFSYNIPSSISPGVHSLTAQGQSSGNNPGDINEPYSTGTRVLVGSVTVEKKRKVLGEEVKPLQPQPVKATTSAKGELPYTGGAPLWALLMGGLALTAAGFSIKVFKKS